jgi:hypothetical protein
MQQLIDCDASDLGCDGGLMDHAYRYDEDVSGLCALSDYPFAYRRHWFYGCSRYMPYCTPLSYTRVSRFVDVNGTERDLMAAIATQPVSVAVIAADDWQFYSSGIYDGGCEDPDDIDHGERKRETMGGGHLVPLILAQQLYPVPCELKNIVLFQTKPSSPSVMDTTIQKRILTPLRTASRGITG